MSAAPPKAVPAGIATVNQAVPAAATPGIPPWGGGLLGLLPWLPTALLVLAAAALAAALILLIMLQVDGIVMLAVAAGLAYAAQVLRGWQASAGRQNAISEAGQTPASVATLPDSPDFALSVPGATFRPSAGGTDSPTAVRFKDALRDSYALRQAGLAAGVRAGDSTSAPRRRHRGHRHRGRPGDHHPQTWPDRAGHPVLDTRPDGPSPSPR